MAFCTCIKEKIKRSIAMVRENCKSVITCRSCTKKSSDCSVCGNDQSTTDKGGIP